MCFGLGSGCCLALIEMMPYICLVTLPLLGSFYGKDVMYRLSLLLLIHSVMVEFISKHLSKITSVLNVLIFGLLMYLPFALIPWPITWLYDKIIWFSDPLLMVAEAVLILNFVMRYSQWAVDEMEANEEDSFKYKSAILLFSSLCYAISCSLVSDIYYTASGSQVLCLFMTLCLLIATHNMMWMAHEGIISDCAFCTLCSIIAIYTMVTEANQIKVPLEQPYQWEESYVLKSSYSSLFESILHMNAANAQRSVEYLKRYFSPFFFGLFALRIYSIIFIANKVTKNFFQGDDEIDLIFNSDDDEDDDKFSAWRSPLLLKMAIIFMLTQMSANFLQEWSGAQLFPATWLGSYYKHSWPLEVLVSRLLQVVAINAFYMWRLYSADSWNWNPWLTP